MRGAGAAGRALRHARRRHHDAAGAARGAPLSAGPGHPDGASLPPRHTALEDAAALLTGSFLVAWGVVLLHSVRGASGGVAGLAFLLAYVSPVPLGVALVVLNVPFAWLAVRRLG
ncbi:hypothetical protein GCM10027047_12610 [Rhodococcus aerolatus]